MSINNQVNTSNSNQPGMMNTSNPNQPIMMTNSRYVALPQNMYIWDFNNNMKFTKDENGLYHSYNDLPAIEYIDNSTTRIWMNMGYVHRGNNKPAYTKMINYVGFSNKVEYREYYNMGLLQNRSIVYYDNVDKVMKEMLI
jgi:hypothetical protein